MNIDFSQPEIIVGAIVLMAILYKTLVKHKDEEGRIMDSSVKISNVIESVEEFAPKLNPKLKDGYTEKSIQNQLKRHLQDKYVNVVDEYGIEGTNATKIDFDIGNGKVGLELKLAKALFKTSNLHRLVGQIEDYVDKKYDEDNLIVAVYGEKHHSRERTMLETIQTKIEEKGGEYIYLELPR